MQKRFLKSLTKTITPPSSIFKFSQTGRFKFVDKTVSVVGVRLKEGQLIKGVEEAPSYFRQGGLLKAIKALGWKIEDKGDLSKEDLQSEIDKEIYSTKKYKYFPANIEVIGVINRELSKIAKNCSSKGNFFLTLGGNHGLATGSISGIMETHKDLKVIWIDAHGDCNTPEISPSGNYNGMLVAHLCGWMPQGSVKAFDWLLPSLNPKNIVYIGLRDLDDGEKALIEKHKIRIYTPYDIEKKGGIARVMDEALNYLEADKDHQNPIHVSWDVDGSDPSFMKAAGTKARCGLTERESHFILQRVFETGNFVSLDVVEMNPKLEEPEEKNREVLHGDNKLLKGTPSVVNAMELILSALGSSWR